MSDAEALSLHRGAYRVLVTAGGGGLSSRDDLALNRWPADVVEDRHGFFVYLRDVGTGHRWSAATQPLPDAAPPALISQNGGAITIERDCDAIASKLVIALGDGDEEIRALTLTNRDPTKARTIEVTSLLEVALAPRGADLEHPAFARLFVQTERRNGVLIARRRPRGNTDHWPMLYHTLLDAPVESWETDRAVLLGRGCDATSAALRLQGGVGNMLDTAFALRTTVVLAPGASQTLRYVLGIADDSTRADALAAMTQVRETSAPALAPEARCEGAFVDQGREYQIHLPRLGDGLALPPMPWANVLANPNFGALVTETGAGATWSRNSQANRLTPWSNDPVCDPVEEAYYLRDNDSGAFWSPLPGPAPAATEYVTTHGFGYSRFETETQDIRSETTIFVARSAPLKVHRIRLTNTGKTTRRLGLFSYQRLVLGTLPTDGSDVAISQRGNVLQARRPRPDFGDGIAFSYWLGDGVVQAAATGSRRAFLGNRGQLRQPSAVRVGRLADDLSTAGGACFARTGAIELAPGATATWAVVLGEGTSDAQCVSLRSEYGDIAAINAALADIQAFWHEQLEAIRVTTPMPEIDTMVNGWLPYQALACRVWGRTAYYQSSGAYGYRDQLQDAGNLCALWPQRTREQILLHAGRQFREGDVQHWWHEAPIDRGIRTRFSDDLLWLPFVTANYLRSTGDAAVLDEIAPFLDAAELEPGEEEHYVQADRSVEAGDVYTHCCRAIDRSLALGAHGLPLMGTGDWNDGMNRVGREGRGESVWMGFFLYGILGDFAALARTRGDDERAIRYLEHRELLRSALNQSGWDGGWYRRAYYDDGTPLGTADGSECRIDGLAQAWAVLSEAAPPERAEMAMDAAERMLIREDDGIICLLTPPFVDTPHDPGYIKGYVAGVRENGGQYTHAACWVVAALAKLGRRDRAARLLARLGPMWHTRDAAAIERYKIEPYVIAADIYGTAPHVGRGGWTWYTGSAGWAWRVAVESVLGLRYEQGNTLVLAPCVPDEWPSYQMVLRSPRGEAPITIDIVNPSRQAKRVVAAVDENGKALPIIDGTLRWPLPQDQLPHQLTVTLGGD